MMHRRQHGRIALFFTLACALLWLASGCNKIKWPGKAQVFFNEDDFKPAPEGGGERPDILPIAPPLSLTCSDGAGLQLKALTARAVIDGPLAFTELKLRFHNPEPRVREGRFSITLPPRAAISRFAMKIGDQWREGEVVEKQQANRIYEDFLHRKQDPALLEVDAGNTFRARVFPIPGSGDKELILSFSSELPSADEPYVLPLRGLGKLADLHVAVHVLKGASARSFGAGAPGDKGGHGGDSTDEGDGPEVAKAELVRRDFAPQADVVIHPSAVRGRDEALRNGELVLARVQLPKGDSEAEFDRVVVMLDTSASSALDFKGRLDHLDGLMAFLASHKASKVAVMAFDQEVVDLYDGPPGEWGKTQRATLETRGPLGASDYSRALAAAAKLVAKGGTEGDAGSAGSKNVRVLLYGNGIATTGPRTIDALKSSARALGAAAVTRLDTLESNGARDLDVLRALATAGLAHDGIHVQIAAATAAASPAAKAAPNGPGPAEAGAAFAALAQQTFKPIQVAVAGSAWVWPRTLEGLQAGDSALIYTEVDASGDADDDIELELKGGVEKKVSLKLTPTARPLLQRAWVAARIRRLLYDSEFGDPDMRPVAKAQALKLSITHRVLSDLTALLVLETEQDYDRYKLDRTALADVLSISRSGRVVHMDRKSLHEGALADLPKNAEGDSAARKDEAESAVRPGRLEMGDGNERIAVPAPAAAPPEDAPAAAPEQPRPESAGRAPTERQAVVPTVEAKSVPCALGPTSMLFGHRDEPEEEDVVPNRAFGSVDEEGDAAGPGRGGLNQGGGGGTAESAKRGGGGSQRSSGRDNDVARPTEKQESRVIVRMAAGPLDGPGEARSEVGKIVARKSSAIQWCFEQALRNDPNVGGKVTVQFTVGTEGTVSEVAVRGATGEYADCIKSKFMSIRGLPKLMSPQSFTQTFVLSHDGYVRPAAPSSPPPDTAALERERKRLAAQQAALARQREQLERQRAEAAAAEARAEEERQRLAVERERAEALEQRKRELSELESGIANTPNVTGRYAKIRGLLEANKRTSALAEAWAWSQEDVGDILALVALGEVFEAMDDPRQAARAYGSLIDLFPSRADLRRFAGNLLERNGGAGDELAADTYLAAVDQRPDHPSGFHNLAMALARRGDYDGALAAIERARKEESRWRSPGGVMQILADDEQIIRAVKAAKAGNAQAISPSLRFIITWETDANDVDFHIFDKDFDHASYRKYGLDSGGSLYADITTGYGPECFNIDSPSAYPYRLLAHYFSRGPMGYGMGRVQVIRHDGKGGLGFESRAFVIMQDGAYVDLGTVTPKSAPIL